MYLLLCHQWPRLQVLLQHIFPTQIPVKIPPRELLYRCSKILFVCNKLGGIENTNPSVWQKNDLPKRTNLRYYLLSSSLDLPSKLQKCLPHPNPFVKRCQEYLLVPRFDIILIMTKRTRRLLFYLFILIFILLCAVVLFIAFGYGYDFAQNKIVKTGTLGVESNISASVYINDQFQGQTSFLTNSFTKNRLVPDQYTIRLEKKDFVSWQKRVNVRSGIYIDFPTVVLVLEQPKTDIIANNVSPVLGSRMIYGDWLFYFNKKGFLGYINIHSGNLALVKEFDGVGTPKITMKYKLDDFDETNNTLIISSGTITYLLDLASGDTKTLNNLSFKNLNSAYLRNAILYGLNGNQLMAYDTATGVSKVFLKKVQSFSVNDDSLAYIDTGHNLHFYSLANNQEFDLTSLPSGIIKISQLIQHNNDYYLILHDAVSSMLYKLNADGLVKLSDYANYMQVSPNKDRLFYNTDHEVSVLYLNTTNKQPYINSGDQELITRESKLIYNPTWSSDEEHLLARIDNNLTMTELDGRGGRNIYHLGSTVGFDYDERLDTIYNFQDGNLYKLTLK